MSKTMYEIKAIVGRYTDKNGDQKSRYQHIGSIVETKNGPMLKLDSIPVAEEHWSGWAYLNKPMSDEEKEKMRSGKGKPRQDFEDQDVPF